MEKIDKAIVSLQQVKDRQEILMKACNVLIPGFTFIQDSNYNIPVNVGMRICQDKAPVTGAKFELHKGLENLSLLPEF